ncbi:MAG: hypothetical protein AAB677_02590 [Patescibacteria group bacterium]|mgnify:CR=1 FL=1
MFKRILVALLILGFMAPLTTGAQNTSASIEELLAQIRNLQRQIEALRGGSNAVQCFTFNRNLGVGAAGRDVWELHNALAREGFSVVGARIAVPAVTNPARPTIDPSLPQYDDSGNPGMRDDVVYEEDDDQKIEAKKNSERYTEATAAAVSQFQLKYKDEILTPNGLGAPTGYFGPATRKKMNSLYCNVKVPMPTPLPIPVPSQPLTVISPNGGESWLVGSNQNVKWLWSGPPNPSYPNWTSTNHNIYLIGGNSKWSLGQGVDSRVGSNGVGFPVVVPSVPAGAYKISVCDDYLSGATRACDSSDSYFKIYGGDQTGNRPPTVSSVEGPTTLRLGETGTWTIKAFDPENGPLSYSVWWGDEMLNAGADNLSAGKIPAAQTQQTATFTHAYTNLGARYYYPRFTVTDNAGQSNNTSIGVSVGEETTVFTPLKVIWPNGDEVWAIGSSQKVEWTGGRADRGVNIFLIDSRPDRYVTNSRLLTYNTNNDGSEKINVPTDMTPGPYKIRVACQNCATNTSGWFDDSDNSFALVNLSEPPVQPANQSPQIVTPPLTPVTSVGEPATIVLTASDPDGDPLSLAVDWGDEVVSVDACTARTGKSFVQSQELRATHTWQAAEDYNVKLTVSDCRGGMAKYEMKVDVKPQQPPQPTTLQILSPNGGEVWAANSEQEIKWISPGTQVQLFLGSTGSPVVGPIAGPIANTGSYIWTIPSGFEGDHFIRITCTGGECGSSQWNLWDESNGSFKIVPQ